MPRAFVVVMVIVAAAAAVLSAEGFSAARPKHRIAVRTVGGAAELYDRTTGRRFVPRGVSYHRFGTEGGAVVDTLFSRWQRRAVAADLSSIARLGYNTVRTSLDLCRDECIGSPAGGLRARYLDHVSEFIRLAKARRLQVILNSNDLPKQGGFVPKVEATCCSLFDGYINAQYLSPVGYRTYRDYWTTVVRALLKRKTPLDAILSYTIRAEMFFFTDKPPLSLQSGARVTAANGRTYTLPGDRDRLIAEGTRFWLGGIRTAIRRLDPTALVSAGVFAPNDPYPWRAPEDTRGVFVEPIFASSVDFVLVHPYPGVLPFDQLAADLRLSAGAQSKPVVMGEFGGFRYAYDSPAAAALALMDWQVASCGFGIDGWIHWHYKGQDDPEVWTGTDGGGVINRVLSPAERPDPCQARSFPDLARNLALGRPVDVSSEQPDSPGRYAVDGSRASSWISGAGAPGWIEVHLAAPSTIREIRLVVNQFPSGRTVHRVLARIGGGLQELHTFDGDTSIGQTLDLKLPQPVANVASIRVETDVSPSFVAWYEIEAFG
jgi:hypothetical protein